jgi:hypothetical protein
MPEFQSESNSSNFSGLCADSTPARLRGESEGIIRRSRARVVSVRRVMLVPLPPAGLAAGGAANIHRDDLVIAKDE